MSTRDRLIQAAFALFDERGFDATTVDDVAERAGVGRTTFFRSFRSKEEVIFPDHDRLVGAIDARLAAATSQNCQLAVTEAARIVLTHYLGEGERARIRYRLVSSVPALRSRELAGQIQYQRLFRSHVHRWLDGTPETALQAELLGNAVVTAHNHVLRHWLRGLTSTPEADFDAAMDSVVDWSLLVPRTDRNGPPNRQESTAEPTTLATVRRTVAALDELLPALRGIVDAGDPTKDGSSQHNS